jgi:hypothetical protein
MVRAYYHGNSEQLKYKRRAGAMGLERKKISIVQSSANGNIAEAKDHSPAGSEPAKTHLRSKV